MPRSGITYAAEFGWIIAAQWAGYTWREFSELDGDEQAHIVAAYECNQQMTAVVAHEQHKEQQRAAKRGRGKRR